MVDICQLLLLGDGARLAQQGREDEGLLDSRRALVHVHLLAVARHALEADALRLAVDQDGPADLAEIFALGEDVEEAAGWLASLGRV